MKRARRAFSLFLAVVFAAAAGGCWDYNETEEVLYPLGVSFDRFNGRLHGAIEVATQKGPGEPAKPEYLEVDGDTFYDVIRNAVKVADRPLQWSHVQAVVISREVARHDMAQLLDMLIRLPQVRNTLVIFVSKEATAQEVMEAPNYAREMNAIGMIGSLKAEKQLEKAPYIQLYEFADAVSDERQSAVLPAAGLANTSHGKVVEVSGSAVFRGPWLQGFIDECDTRVYMLVEFGQSLFSMPLTADPGGKFKSASIQFYLKKIDIVPDFTNGRAKVSIYIRGEAIPVEIDGASTDPKKFKTVTDAILAAASTALENSVKAMLKRTQEMGGCDILNIGYRLRKSMPDTWRQINCQWRDYYSAMEVDVRADVTLRHTGNEAEPISKGR